MSAAGHLPLNFKHLPIEKLFLSIKLKLASLRLARLFFPPLPYGVLVATNNKKNR